MDSVHFAIETNLHMQAFEVTLNKSVDPCLMFSNLFADKSISIFTPGGTWSIFALRIFLVLFWGMWLFIDHECDHWQGAERLVW